MHCVRNKFNIFLCLKTASHLGTRKSLCVTFWKVWSTETWNLSFWATDQHPSIFWTSDKINLVLCFLKIIWKKFPFMGSSFGLLVTSPQGFKIRVDPLTRMLCCLYAIRSSKPPLAWHLLTSWWLAWQLSPFDPYTCAQALVDLESGICHATASQCGTRLTLYRLSYAGSDFEARVFLV